MKEWAVLLLPAFAQMHRIDALRSRYDPLAEKVRPHITLVFPFKAAYSVQTLAAMVDEALRGEQPFALEMGGLSAVAQWLFLDVRQGRDEIVRMHEALYAGALCTFKPAWCSDYRPHMTVGQFDSADTARRTFEAHRDFQDSFHCTMDTVCVEEIGPHGESIPVYMHRLGG